METSPEIQRELAGLDAAVSPPVSETPEKPKHKGGRPRKDGKPRKSDLEMLGIDGGPEAASGPELGAAEPGAEGIEIPDVVLRRVLDVPYMIARMKTDFPGFKLDAETEEGLLPLLQQVVKQYLPAINAEHTPAALLVGTMVTGFIAQLQAYKAWKAEQQQHSQASPDGSAPGSHPVSRALVPVTLYPSNVA